MSRGEESRLTYRRIRRDELSYETPCPGILSVIEPKTPDARDLGSYVMNVAADLRREIAERGAVLLRGFRIDSATDFQAIIDALGIKTAEYPYLTSNYRRKVHRSVVTASSVPRRFPIPPHTEQPFSSFRPGTLGFCCLIDPGPGGETPLHDMRAVTDELSPETLAMLRGANYCKMTRGMGPEGIKANFGDSDRDKVLAICNEMGVECSFRGSTLDLVTQGPCLTRHPTDRRDYFSTFSSTIPALLYFCSRFPDVAGTSSVLRFLSRMPGVMSTPIVRASFRHFRRENIYFLRKDGKDIRIPNRVHQETNTLVWKHSLIFRWRKGDILLFDNIKLGHARMPFVPPRQLVAVVGDYYDARARAA